MSNCTNSMIITRKEPDGRYQEYLVVIESGEVRAHEINELPGTKHKVVCKIDDYYKSNEIVYILIEDLSRLSGKSVDDVSEFLGIDL